MQRKRLNSGIPPVLIISLLVLGAGLARGGAPRSEVKSAGEIQRSGEELYRTACQSCHGADGTGNPVPVVGFEVPLPDFSDCSFVSREPDGDWGAVVLNGGPARAFDTMMPSFKEALSPEEVGRVLAHVRTFCDEPDSWPRGDLNLPRAMFTTKAFPEDEAVFSLGANTVGDHKMLMKLIYETRIGARGQVEAVLPFVFREQSEDGEGWTGGVGDLVLATKWAIWHSMNTGSILSVGAELIMPTGDEDRGLGKGFWVVEPFLAFGQILPLDAFVQVHAGMEISTDLDMAPHEVFWRAALGMTFFQDSGLGRAWSPMVEVLGAAELGSETELNWDIVPQLQVALPTRQHVLAAVGVKLPVNEFEDRPKEVLFYLLWDWFDGPLHEGW